MTIPPANGSDQNSVEEVYMALMGIPGGYFRLCPLAAPSPTTTRLKGVRIRPTACLRSFRLRWWSGWHRGVLRGFAGWVWVLLALSAKPPCPWLRLQAINTAIRAMPAKEGKDVAMNNGMLIQRKVPGQPVVRRPIPTL